MTDRRLIKDLILRRDSNQSGGWESVLIKDGQCLLYSQTCGS